MVLFGPKADVVAQIGGDAGAACCRVGKRCCSGSCCPLASDQNWGAASTQLVHALMDEHALAILRLIGMPRICRSNWR